MRLSFFKKIALLYFLSLTVANEVRPFALISNAISRTIVAAPTIIGSIFFH